MLAPQLGQAGELWSRRWSRPSSQATLHAEVAKGTVLTQTEDIQQLFHYLEVLMIVVWSFYPVVVFFGRAQVQRFASALCRACSQTHAC